jgi:hypothetical protein
MKQLHVGIQASAMLAYDAGSQSNASLVNLCSALTHDG